MHSLMGTSQEAFKLKASLFTLTTFHLFSADAQLVHQQLKPLVAQTPRFFQQLPIILDLFSLPAVTGPIDFPGIISCLRGYGLIPVGVRGGNAEQQTFAIQSGLAILANVKTESTDTSPKINTASPAINSKLITQPVRSGQQIYAKNSDLIVIASVSPGAELLADGNIHIYGRLKGRALAGVTGNQHAHIFCQNLEAELVAIAGHYWLSEDLQDLQQTLNNGSVHISLEQERLQMKQLA
ncbi:septum site-determining protein MinC [Candidatus Rickettsiella isopodorum]|jgi:septum site-determining protein MinC|uniref:Probable septum site-determining protein MinC n=1 Tax=Candidatus Rickettsiella isopodorum TaxID=1225476 RepID=A0A1J8P889_9COXI|nr:septum site-determining protein MinC [Candidatus Rickettsiella isopodorum]MCH9636669.1 septum site-determining protein MinC [Gammaproteobacteria bacterium]MDQ5899215.1 putative septum site-determining protein MinC [Pseudomonadota bacterium]MCH9754755.1 septum site-determining protein MinC [Gammaproteobacteria bacterium]MDD5161653.1 septum site-determining protein MinC [Candidatus Rickettsiella isopodorum]OIZ95211.1 septum site-determining protein MinC [Candidatus Rickettsiella isopodorum]